MPPIVRHAALAAAGLFVAGGVGLATLGWITSGGPATAAGVIVEGTEPLTPARIADSASGIVTGNPLGDVTIVEFFDYQCPVCRQVHPDVKALVEEDGGIRLVHKHWPIFGAGSEHAAELAMAARWQNRYDPVHEAFMGLSGRLNRDGVRAAAAEAGLDLARADADLQARRAEVDAALAEAAREAILMGLQGTPGFLIGNYVVPGGLDKAGLAELVAGARAGKDAL
ncbi:DsbA family protein [Caenispirillum bisanense]|uniref:Protein-disulfide isomerase n=1 Tax=Caenispirillum bisanense TaxID=414052 RepID=A0A286G7Q6_9PROT|nr:DsbA family protein [Caenispirillum bisanense]SOD91169.1 Protein-disulfide isomerase [Caenispirillum bisanense]